MHVIAPTHQKNLGPVARQASKGERVGSLLPTNSIKVRSVDYFKR